jgi:hypothetical protein
MKIYFIFKKNNNNKYLWCQNMLELLIFLISKLNVRVQKKVHSTHCEYFPCSSKMLQVPFLDMSTMHLPNELLNTGR